MTEGDALTAFLECRFEEALQAASSDAERNWVSAAVSCARGDLEAAIEPARDAFEDPRFRTAAALTLGSALRQLGRYTEAETIDEAALSTADLASERSHLLVSYAADAVGLGDPDRCFRRLQLAVSMCERPDARLRVRHGWVATEFCLMTSDPTAAIPHAERSIAASDGMPRHLAKSSLFLGVAHASAGQTTQAIAALDRALEGARAVGARRIADIALRQRSMLVGHL